jgi:threonine dehydratase
MAATYSGIHPERFFGVDGYVGNTPLIRLRRLSELTSCEILGKAEFMNPTRPVKLFTMLRNPLMMHLEKFDKAQEQIGFAANGGMQYSDHCEQRRIARS